MFIVERFSHSRCYFFVLLEEVQRGKELGRLWQGSQGEPVAPAAAQAADSARPPARLLST